MEQLRRLIFDAVRVLQVCRVILRFGLPLLVTVLLHPRRRLPNLGVALREALERLGLTYLKLGQYLATRHDLIPPEVCAELEKVFENVSPISWTEVQAVLDQELGPNVSGKFAVFHTTPVAAASIAQVHKARTTKGDWVAVKIQRPGIGDLFASDIRNLRRLAYLIDRFGISGAMSVTEAIEQVEAYTRREMDFLIEGRTADRLRRNLTGHAVVPKIYWELSTVKVLTMDFISGPSLLQVIHYLEAGDNTSNLLQTLPKFNREKILENLTYASLYQLFITGFFHGDPHPGNIVVLHDNRIAFLDFGIFGELNYYQRALLANYTASLAAGDVPQCYRYISKIYFPTAPSDEAAFEQDVQGTLKRWYRRSSNPRSSPQERHIGGAFDAMVRVVYRHRYRATMGYLLFWRAIIVLDSVAIRLQPGFDLSRQARNFFEREQPDVLRRYLGWCSLIPDRQTFSRRQSVAVEPSSVAESVCRIEIAQTGAGYPSGIRSLFFAALLLVGAARLNVSTPVLVVGLCSVLVFILAARMRME